MKKDLVRAIVNTPWVKNLEQSIPKYSKVGDSVFFSNDQFPWSRELEANWETIREELDGVLAHAEALPNFQDISARQRTITQDDRWKTYFFCAFGFVAKGNCDRCPKTWELIRRIPGLKVAFFSILAPGKHIPKHRGKHKGLIRYHLGLRVPEPRENCWIQVDGHQVHWEEGKSLIFDDTFRHSVQNDTDGYRAILFLDIARPLKFPMSLVNWTVNAIVSASPLIQGARTNHENWEKQFEAILK